MAYNNDYNYAAIDYIKQPSYYELMRSSAATININSRLQNRQTTTSSPQGSISSQILRTILNTRQIDWKTLI